MHKDVMVHPAAVMFAGRRQRVPLLKLLVLWNSVSQRKMRFDVGDQLRRLIGACFSTYQSVPKTIDSQTIDDEQRSLVATCSRNFREHLRRCVNEINSAAERLDGDETNGEVIVELIAVFDLLHSVEKSWHLCEIFVINPSRLLSLDLVAWLKEICYAPDSSSQTHLFAHTHEPEAVPGYWDAVYEQILQGNLGSAGELLLLHSELVDVPTTAATGAITSGQVVLLMDLLATHPLLAQLKPELPGSVAPTATNVSAEFTSWQNRVKKLRGSGLPLLTHIPELDTVLRILAGEKAALEHYAGVQRSGEWAWARLAVAQLLYVYPPPLGRQDLSRVMQACMDCAHPPVATIESGYIATLREVMSGRVGPVLKSLYQLGSGSGVAGLALHMCAAHLSLLLASTLPNAEDLLIPLPEGPSETSFFEELFLEAAERLASAGFEPEMVVQYLAVCPLRGRDYVRALIPALCAHTDRSTRTVARLLSESAGWSDEADAVLRARGMWWVSRNAPPPAASPVGPGDGDGGRPEVLQGSTLAKAAVFFLAASDVARVSALLEASLSRCMWAVAAATQAFASLSICPTAWGPYRERLPQANTAHRGSEDRLLELECALLEAGELLLVASPDEHASHDSVFLCCYSCLDTYVGAVQLRFDPEPTVAGLRAAASRLAGLITGDGHSGPVLPMRYWLHALELVAWLYNAAPKLHSGSVRDCSHEDDMEVEGPVAAESVTKKQAFALVKALQELECSFCAKELVDEAAPDSDHLRNLRLSLLGVLCAATIQDNALRARTTELCRSEQVKRERCTAFVSGRGTVTLAAQARFQHTLMHEHRQDANLQEAITFELLAGSDIGFW